MLFWLVESRSVVNTRTREATWEPVELWRVNGSMYTPTGTVAVFGSRLAAEKWLSTNRDSTVEFRLRALMVDPD